MVNLQAISPCAGLLPLTIGAVTLTEKILPEGQVWSIAPLQSSPVKSLPKIGKSKLTQTSNTLWIGRDQFLQIGGKRPGAGAVTEQDDAWVMVSIEGDGTLEVMARLVPIDLRKMEVGDTARSLINHMMAIFVKTEDGVDVLVFRAFAKTLVHELKEAAQGVDARKGLSL